MPLLNIIFDEHLSKHQLVMPETNFLIQQRIATSWTLCRNMARQFRFYRGTLEKYYTYTTYFCLQLLRRE